MNSEISQIENDKLDDMRYRRAEMNDIHNC